MLKGKHPREALHLIDRLGLYSVIFTDPTKDAASSPAVENWKLVYDCLETLQGNKTPGSIYDTLVRSEDAQFVAWILAAVTPWSSVPLPEAKPGAKLLLPYATLVGREGIKVNNKISDIITAAFRNLDEITALRNAIQKKEPYVSERDTLGMMIRRWDWQGKNWRLEVLLAIFVEVLNKAQADYTEIFASWQTFIDHLEGMGLMNAPSIPPKVNGVQLMKALEIKKAGAWMKPALDVCMEWQLRNPDLEDTDGAIEEVKKRKEDDRTTLPPQTLPKQFSLAQLRDEVTSSDRNKNKTDEFQNLLILNSCLTNRERLDRDSSDDNEAAIDLLVWTSRAILPDGSIIPQDDAPEAKKPARRL
ncbi:putative CCA tRNA nucleotidyltransferase 2 [Glarea lozoyensis 74030]|uniref:Putative CCA tRNA nucleotidyltransferase 2 n=1 Tax=Glarea lozoyensis (strain ATCC 74030 / MF5533) TaxID=1104152 RepID=H0EPA2_GLAL7|nr:putative CCA tRNA nucleotidyltransferase 2 [Glarea lozoyensis 74030]